MRATPEQRALAAETANRDFLSYVIHMRPDYEFAPHNLLIIDHLAAAMRGEIPRLMITIPPRHGKSLLTSQLGPAFYLGCNPDNQAVGASYGQDLSNDFSAAVREQIKDDRWPFPNVILKPGANNVKRWRLSGKMHDPETGAYREHRGGYTAAGIGGALTGRGAHWLNLDDVVKDRVMADSVVWREKSIQWYQDVARTRLMPGGFVTMTLTRWHEGDLAGYLLDQAKQNKGPEWTVLCMPARAYDYDKGENPWYAPGPDPLGRAPGEPLWPEMFGTQALLDIENESSARTWASLFQQTPSVVAGTVFLRTWFDNRFQEQLSRLGITEVKIFVDGAYKEGVANSESAAVAWGRGPQGLYVLACWHGQVEFPDLQAAVVDFWVQVKDAVGLVPTVVIENKASGISLIQSIQRASPMIPIDPFPNTDVELQKKLASTSKEARADSATPPFKAGVVYLPDNVYHEAPWLMDFISQHVNFPSALRNDMVDTTSMAIAVMYTEMKAFAAVDLVDRQQMITERLQNAQQGYNATRVRTFDPGASGGYNARRGRQMDR